MSDQLPLQIGVFFTWLASSAGIGAVMSEFFEREKWFDALSAQAKNRLVLLVSIGLGILSWFVGTQVSPEILAKIQPIATIVIGSLAVYLYSQRYHDKAHSDTTSTELNMNLKTQTPGGDTTTANSGGPIVERNINTNSTTGSSGSSSPGQGA